MELPTFTSIWRTKRIFYSVEDVRLPVPVPADVLLLTAVCFALWDGMWGLAIGVAPFQMMFGGSWFAVAACWYVLPPFFTARLIARPNREGKNAIQIVASRYRYLIRPRTLDGYVSRRHTTIWARTHRTPTRVPASRSRTQRQPIPQARYTVSARWSPRTPDPAPAHPRPSHGSKHRAGSAPGKRRRPS